MTPVVYANSGGISVSNQPLAPEELRKINAACKGLGFLGLKFNDTGTRKVLPTEILARRSRQLAFC